MLKRFVWMGIVCGLLAGCQTAPPMAEKNFIPVHPPVAVQSSAVPMPADAVMQDVKINPVQRNDNERTPLMILMKTSMGDIKIELNAEKAPKTVANFMKYVESDHYTGTIFHRVIDGFMIQGGGFTAKMSQKNAPYTVENEADNGLSNDVGTIAMARTNDPHSGGAQFFINVKDNAFLNHTAKDVRGWGYCVFGKVVEGMDVVNAIKGVATGASDVPNEPVIIESVTVVD
jgi:peptidyl-prolyl cis-trans isomerase B (cyclophilin B)